jgi:aminoglycoside phosphotransferase (APT) family kinase protein
VSGDGVSAQLEHSQVAHYLLSLGLVKPSAVVEGDLVVTDVSHRNTVFLATSSGGPAYVVKEAGPASAHTVAREAVILRGFERDPRLSGMVPELVHYDEAELRLVLRSPRDGVDWGRRKPFSRAAARSLGHTPAAVHAARVEVEALPESDERAWGLTLPEPSLDRVRTLSEAALALLRQVQADTELCDRLRGLREEPGEPGFVHGDVRWENCVAVAAPGSSRRTRLLLIDWEHAGPGRPEADVGAALAEYLRAWVASIPVVSPGSDHERIDADARHSIQEVQPPMREFWSAYRRASGRRPDMIRATEFTAVRVLEIAFEYARGTTFLSGHVKMLVQIAANMLRMPGYAAWNLLGLRA